MLNRGFKRRLYQLISIILCISMLTGCSPLAAGPARRPRPSPAPAVAAMRSPQASKGPISAQPQPVPHPPSLSGSLAATPSPAGRGRPGLAAAAIQPPSVAHAAAPDHVASSAGPLAGRVVLRRLASGSLSADISLMVGWNLVSIPEEPADTDPAAVLASIAGSYNLVYAYDGCDDADPWKLYDPAALPPANDLTAIDHRIGFWIEMTADATLTVDGIQHTSTDIQLCEGWNLIGYPLDRALPVAIALASIAGKYTLVFAYDPTDADDPWEVYDVAVPAWANDLQVMEPGRGYWVYATEDVTLTIAEATPTPTPTVTPTVGPTPTPTPVPVGQPPTAQITSPAEGTEVTDFVDIIGTADDPDGDLVEYRLQYRQVGLSGTALRAQQTLRAMGLLQEDAEWTTFATGNAPVVNDVLGTLDPTLMLNGMFEVRVLAIDSEGQRTTVSVHLVISGEQKVGHFRLTFKDLEISVSGLDLIVWRTYDSRDKRVGDFGYGWTMGLVDVQVTENGTPGEEWEQPQEPGFVPRYCVRATKPHIVSVALPGGQVHQFAMRVSPECQGLVPIRFAKVTYTALPGTTSCLEPLAGTDVWVDGFGGAVTLREMDSGLLNVYNPPGYRLTARDGTSFAINEVTGLQSVRDRNGNTLSFRQSGLTHSTGKGLTFQRDALGRIVQITDPMGYTLNYAYDANGDLVSVTDQEGNVTTFTYDDNHYLLEIHDPLGRTPSRTEYDEDGRVIATTDAEDNRTEYTHDLDGNREIITDPYGNQTIMEYNARGDVTAITDPLGNTSTYTYDDQGHTLTETDPLGNETAYTYDDQGNLLTTTTALGDTFVNTVNEYGDLLSIADPLGNTVTQTYDDWGNRTSHTDQMGNVSTYTYDANGNLTSQTDPLGDTTSQTYNQYGDLTSQTNALGDTTTYTYDDNGNQLSGTTTRTLADGSLETVTTGFVYDRRTQPVSRTDAEGVTHQYSYDATGKLTGITDSYGHTTAIELTDRGQTGSVTFPNGTADTYTYDKLGRTKTYMDRDGRTTTYDYDAAGKVAKHTTANGAGVEMTYDAGGRPTSIVDLRGKTHQFDQDELGRLVTQQDPLGNVTEYRYSSISQLTSILDARGKETRLEYDAAGRPFRRIFADGTEMTVVYDAAGRTIAETDQAGWTTNYTYNALGRLTAVTDALGQVTRYAYDEVGNLVSVTDANGNTTTYEYDSLSQRTRRALPLGQFETWSYDDNGNVVSHTDMNGNTTLFEYDINNQLVRRIYPDGTSESFTYRDNGQRATATDGRGTTTYHYNVRGKLVRRTDPDGRAVSYTYDSAGLRTSVTTPAGTTTFAYDDAARLQTVTDPDGGVTSYTYDVVGNLTGITYPNGNVSTLGYDSLNRVSQVEHRAGGGALLSSHAYTRDAVGNIAQVVEDTGRQVDYTYDSLNRLVEEKIQDPVHGNEIIQYTYDAVGNRLTKTDASGSVTYTYDANDRLLDDGTYTYTYDANGNRLSKTGPTQQVTYEYDFQNRLVRATVTSGGVTNKVEYQYDADGNRVQKTFDGAEVVNYLLDTVEPFVQVLLETDGAGDTLASYVYGHDLISQKRGGSVSYYQTDATFSTRLLTDSTGAVTDSYTYDAFGLLRHGTGATANSYRFTGEQFDSDLGLYYLRARYLDPATGRFLSRDLVEGDPRQPQTLHPYVYAQNNPVNRFDPSGMFSLVQTVVVAGIIGFLAGMNAVAILGNWHPLLWGATREEWTEADKTNNILGFWLQMASSVDASGLSIEASAQLTISRALNTPVATRHKELVVTLDVTSLLQPVVAFMMMGMGAVNIRIGGEITALAARSEDAVGVGVGLSMVVAGLTIAALGFVAAEPALGVSIGLSYVWNARDSGKLDGLAIGSWAGVETPGGVIVGFDIAMDIGIDTKQWRWNGLVTLPSLGASAAGGISTGGGGGFLAYWAERIQTFYKEGK